ncbi:RNA-directed DNA polymerase, eukaryota, reverse transcriptase zinc-binding domain protein [Tanacetum coccineum]
MQGDPLSPFLFLLIMESLHISMQRVVDAGLFKGIQVGSSLQVSHLFYADDVVFMGHWSEANIAILFFVCWDSFLSRLVVYGYINMLKSQTHGEIFGSKVGCLMSRIQSWSEIVNNILTRLSKWKLKTLSIGGRLTLLKSVLEKGGLGVSSFYALNRALLFKWVWRFCTQQSALWTKIIKGIHGEDGKIGGLKLSHDDLLCSFRRAPRAGAEELQYIQLVKIMEGITLFDSKDRWRWSLEGCGEFTVASVRNLLDANSLPVVSSKTRWIKVVPIKVNIHAWKVKLDILPTRLNISKRGMDIESILCPLCEKNVESSSHIFFTCLYLEDYLARFCFGE